MTIESAVLVRRFARIACLVLLVGLVWSSAAPAQLPVKAPVVVAGSVVPFGHGSTGPWSQIYSIKFAPNGNLLFLDSAISNLYQLAPGSSTPTLVVAGAPNGGTSNCSTLEASGTYWNAAIAFDKQNNLYVTDRYGSAVHFCRVPYDPTSKTWIFSAADNWANGPTVTSNGVKTPISPQDITVADDGTFFVSWSTEGEIDKFTVDSSGNTTSVTPVVTGLETMVSNIAVDHAGNLFFIENAYASPGSRVTGIREIPATAKLPLKGDSTGSLESGFPRLDPTTEGLNGIKGMTFDAAGNLYISLANNSSYGGNVSGVLMVPNEGTPTTPNLVWADNVMVAPVYTGFPVAVDPRGYLWIPTGGGGNNWAPPGSNSAPCVTTTNATTNATCTSSSVVLWAMGSAALGASPVGKAGGTQTIFYSWSQPLTFPTIAVASPGSKNFTLLPTNPNADPNANPPVPPCTAGTAYAGFTGQETSPTQYSWCTASVQLNAQSAGSVEGELQLLDASNKVIVGSNVILSGTGQGPNAAVLSPAAQMSVAKANSLSQPNQVAGDPWGNSYVADSALKSIEMYTAGSSSIVGAALGTGLSAPTGVAVDGAGDLFIGDSGNVIEIPYVNGALATKQQTTLATGLGNHLNLAADAQGALYIADADKAQVLRIPNPEADVILQNQPLLALTVSGGWNSPSAIATDSADNVYVADGGSLWQITPWGGSTELTSSLASPVTGLSVDPSGSVFVAGATGLVWIPFDTTTGGLNVNGTVTVAPTVGSGTAVPFSVALDGMENTYVTYGSGGGAGLAQLGVAGSLNWGQVVPFLQSDQEAQIFNLGNAPLTFSAFSGDTITNADYSIGTPADSPACDPANPTPAGTSCFFDVALTPSAAGTSSASLTVLSNAVNAPSLSVSLAADAVPDNRQPTTTKIAITPPSGSVFPGSASIAVTVSSSAGTPAGNVVISVSGQAKQTQALVNGVATFSYSKLLGGVYNVTADYGGSGTAGSSPYPSCATGTSCFAVSAAKASFTINTAAPTVTVGPPTGSTTNVTVWAGNTYVNAATQNTITATVTSSVGTPTGSVSFVQNGKPVDPTQPAIPLDANGNAVFSTANLPVGVYNLTVVYNGDTNYSVTNITIPSFQVIVPSVQITADPDTTSITPGTPDKVTLTLKPLVGFTQQVNVQCVAASLPSYTECTFDNPEIAIGSNGSAPSTIVVTISTNVPVNGSTSSIRGGPAPWSLAAFFGLGLAGLIAGRRRFHRYLMLAFVGLMLSGVFLGVTACTNAGYSTPPPAPKVNTPAGTYAIQIITVDPSNGQQDSLTTPQFTLQATVQ